MARSDPNQMSKRAARRLMAAESHYFRLKAAIESAHEDPNVGIEADFWRSLDEVALAIQSLSWDAEEVLDAD